MWSPLRANTYRVKATEIHHKLWYKNRMLLKTYNHFYGEANTYVITVTVMKL